MSSNDHQDFHPPSATADRQHQPSSSTAGNNLHRFTTSLLPQTQSLMTPANNTNAADANSTPESRLAAALGRVIMEIPPTSFQDAVTAATTNPLIRTLSDAASSPNLQALPPTTPTPPKVPRNNPLRRTLTGTITTDSEQTQKTRKNPIRRASSDPSDYQQPQKTRTPPPRLLSSPTGNQSPRSERLRKLEDMLSEIEQRCWEIMREEHSQDDANPNPNPNPPPSQPRPQPQDEIEECVGAERLKNGDLKFDLTCSCGQRFEVLLKPNGYCFYKLT